MCCCLAEDDFMAADIDAAKAANAILLDIITLKTITLTTLEDKLFAYACIMT